MLLRFTNHCVSVTHQSTPQVCPLYIGIFKCSEGRGRMRWTSVLCLCPTSVMNPDSPQLPEQFLIGDRGGCIRRPSGARWELRRITPSGDRCSPPPHSAFSPCIVLPQLQPSTPDRTPAGLSFDWLHLEQTIIRCCLRL